MPKTVIRKIEKTPTAACPVGVFRFCKKASAAASYPDVERRRETKGRQGRSHFKTWFFGHYHDDEWRDGRHRLIYRDIVPVGVRREDEDREPVG